MLGPSMILGGIPAAVVTSGIAIAKAADRPFAIMAVSIAAIELVALIVVLALEGFGS